MANIRKIEWYVEEGVQGGQKGIKVDFKTGLMTTWNGRELPITENKEDVLWVIDNNIIDKKEKVGKLQTKINVTETTRVPIKDGYKLIEPLSDTQKVRFADRVNDLSDEINQLNNLKVKYS